MLPRLTHAIVRRPATTLGAGLTTVALGTPDHDLAGQQFDRYVDALGACGLTVEILEALTEFPDAHFVEDTAVIVDDVAVITRPGATARRDEIASMEPVLASHFSLRRIEAPGTLDGGDVLVVAKHAFIGLSERTDEEGAWQLGAVLEAHDHTWQTVSVGAGLHFKSSVNLVDDEVLLVTREFAARTDLAIHRLIVVPEGEEYACNTLLVNDWLLMPAGYPGTRDLLAPLGREIIELDTSEFRKMDGGLTCLSLRF